MHLLQSFLQKLTFWANNCESQPPDQLFFPPFKDPSDYLKPKTPLHSSTSDHIARMSKNIKKNEKNKNAAATDIDEESPQSQIISFSPMTGVDDSSHNVMNHAKTTLFNFSKKAAPQVVQPTITDAFRNNQQHPVTKRKLSLKRTIPATSITDLIKDAVIQIDSPNLLVESAQSKDDSINHHSTQQPNGGKGDCILNHDTTMSPISYSPPIVVNQESSVVHVMSSQSIEDEDLMIEDTQITVNQAMAMMDDDDISPSIIKHSTPLTIGHGVVGSRSTSGNNALSRAFRNATAMAEKTKISSLPVNNKTQSPNENELVNENGNAFNVTTVVSPPPQPPQMMTCLNKRMVHTDDDDDDKVVKRPKQLSDVIDKMVHLQHHRPSIPSTNQINATTLNTNTQFKTHHPPQQQQQHRNNGIKPNVLKALNKMRVISSQMPPDTSNPRPVKFSHKNSSKSAQSSTNRIREIFHLELKVDVTNSNVKKSVIMSRIMAALNADDQIEKCCVSLMDMFTPLDCDDPFKSSAAASNSNNIQQFNDNINSDKANTSQKTLHILIKFSQAIKETRVIDSFNNLIIHDIPNHNDLKISNVKNQQCTIKWITQSDKSPCTFNINSTDLSMIAQTHMWSFSYPIEDPEPSDSDPFLMTHANSRNVLINAFKTIRSQRLIAQEQNNFAGCSCCSFNAERSASQLINLSSQSDFMPCSCAAESKGLCGLMATICFALKYASNSTRMYLCGRSGHGKTRMIQSHFSDLLTYLPVANSDTFPMDGFNSKHTDVIYFDEFKPMDFPRWLILRLLDRQYVSINQKFKTVNQFKFSGPIAFSSVQPPCMNDEEFFRRLDACFTLDHYIFDCTGQCRFCPIHND